MKSKLLFSVILMCFFISVHAQKDLPKGSVLLGGNIAFSNATYKDVNSTNKTSGFSISPSAGVAVRDNLFVGIGLSYGHIKNSPSFNGSVVDSSRYNSYGINLFVRKYKPLKNNFYLFLETGVGVSLAKRTLMNNLPGRDYYQKDLNVGLGITPGVSYGINSKLQIETGFNSLFGIGYSESKYRDNGSFPGERKSTSFNAFTSLNNFSSQLYIGFRLLLQKKIRI